MSDATETLRQWLLNTEADYWYARELCENARREPDQAKAAFKAWIEGACPKLEGWPGELLQDALREVEWSELVRVFAPEHDDDDQDDDDQDDDDQDDDATPDLDRHAGDLEQLDQERALYPWLDDDSMSDDAGR